MGLAPQWVDGLRVLAVRLLGANGNLYDVPIEGGRVKVDAGASSLPPDASTETTLGLVRVAIDAIKTKVEGMISNPATEATLDAVRVLLAAIKAKTDLVASTPATETTLASVLARLVDGITASLPDLVTTSDLLEEWARGTTGGATLTIVGFAPTASASNVKQTLWPFLPQAGPFVCGSDSYPGANNPPLPAAPLRLFLRSTSALDALGSTGCTRVRVEYLDGDYVERIVERSLAGLTRVEIATDVLRINNLYAIDDGGAATCPIGNVLVVPETALDIYTGLTVDRNASFSSLWTVPAGKRLGISIWSVGAGKIGSVKAARMTLGVKRLPSGLASKRFVARAFMILPMGSAPTALRPMLWLPEKTDLRTTIDTNDAGEFSVTLEGVLETVVA